MQLRLSLSAKCIGRFLFTNEIPGDMNMSLSEAGTSRPVSVRQDEVMAKYTDISRMNIIKSDVQRKGIYDTERSLSVVDPAIHKNRSTYLFGSRDAQ